MGLHKTLPSLFNSSPIPSKSSSIDSSVGACEESVNCLLFIEEESSIPSIFPASNYSHGPLNNAPIIHKLTIMNELPRFRSKFTLVDCEK